MSSKIKNKKVDNLLSDSDDSEIDITNNKAKNDKKNKRKNSAVSDNSNSVNLLKNNNKRKQSKEKKVVKKKKDDSDEDDESEEDVKAKKKEVKGAKGKKKEETSDEESEVKKPANGKAKNNSKSKKHDEDSDVDSDEEDKKKKNKGRKASSTKGKPAKKAAKDSDDEDDDSDEEETTTKKGVKKPSAGRKSSLASKSSVASKKSDKKPKNSKKKADSDDEDEDSDNEVVIKNNNKNNHKAGKAEENEDPNACRELFVKNLAFKATEDSMREHFGEYGNVTNIKVCTDKFTQKPRGFGYVEFEKRSDAQKVINEPGEIEGRPYLVAFSDEKEKLFGVQGGQGQGQGKSFGGGFKKEFSGTAYTVFIGNLGYRTTEDKIKKFFNKCGNVVGVRIAKHEDGKAKGFCHVDFDSQDAVSAACELTGKDLDGREVRIDAAEQKRNRGEGGAPRGGRGGFGGRGGRGGKPGIEKPTHGPMGGTGTKKTFADDEDSD